MTSAKNNELDRPCGCLADPLTKILAKEWATHIIWRLCTDGATRFGVLKRSLPGKISARVLSARLKELESAGLVERRVVEDSILHVEYSLTAAGLHIDRDLHRLESRLAEVKTSTG